MAVGIATTDTEKEIKQYCIDNPWYWMANFVFTLDTDDPQNLIKKFPSDLEYLWWICRLMNTERMLMIPKSSQMKMTWIAVAKLLHKAMYFPGRLAYLQTSKEKKAGWGSPDKEGGATSLTLISRAWHIYQNLPDFLKTPVEPRKEPPLLQFYHNIEGKRVDSILQGVSSAGDEVRGTTPTDVLQDEMAYQPEAEECFIASTARLISQGHSIGLSTPNHKEFFYYKVYDDGTKEGFIKIGDYHFKVKDNAKKLMEGMYFWRNPKNRIAICTLHYHADPYKRTKEWRDLRLQGFGKGTAAWEREFEINFDVEGEYKRIFNYFMPERNGEPWHIRQIIPNPSLPILRIVDWGGNHPAVSWNQIDTKGRWKVLKEYLGEEKHLLARELGREILKISDYCYPNYRFEDYCGFDGAFASDKSEFSNVELLTPMGFEFRYAKFSILKGIQLIDAKLSEVIDGEPGFQVDVSCERTIDGFQGGYKWDKQGNLPLKDNIYDNIFDTYRYGLCHKFSPDQIKSIKPDVPIKEPTRMEQFLNGIFEKGLQRQKELKNRQFDEVDY